MVLGTIRYLALVLKNWWTTGDFQSLEHRIRILEETVDCLDSKLGYVKSRVDEFVGVTNVYAENK